MLTVMVPILINNDVFEPKIINNFIFIEGYFLCNIILVSDV